MQTITWDVDPRDWTTPGSAAVYSRVVGAARPGSIILMHDGGGPRGGTLAALPSIIDTLRARGYGFATVSSLLGQRLEDGGDGGGDVARRRVTAPRRGDRVARIAHDRVVRLPSAAVSGRDHVPTTPRELERERLDRELARTPRQRLGGDRHRHQLGVPTLWKCEHVRRLSARQRD